MFSVLVFLFRVVFLYSDECIRIICPYRIHNEAIII